MYYILRHPVECHQVGKFEPLQWPQDCCALFEPSEAGHINPRKLVIAQQKIAKMNECHFLDGVVTKIEKKENAIFKIQVISSTGP